MGAFGFGSSYNPNAYGSGATSATIAQTVPGYSQTQNSNGNPEAAGAAVDWNMGAANPMKNWGTMITGYDVNQHGGLQGWIDQMNGDRGQVTAETRRVAYMNPLTGLFGQGGLGDLGDGQAAGQYQQPSWVNKQYVAGGSSGLQAGGTEATMPTQTYGAHDPYKNEFGMDASDPNSFQNLYSRMNNLDSSQIQGLSNNIGSAGGQDFFKPVDGKNVTGQNTGIMGAFQSAQQGIVDNYANAAYRSSNPTGQQDSLNWLQASYNTLTNRLNQNGLL